MSSEQSVNEREAPRSLAGLARAVAPALLAGVLLGFIAIFEGAPAPAFFVTIACSVAIDLFIQLASNAPVGTLAARGARIGQALHELSKPTQFMLVAFFVTSIFACELQ